MPTPITPGKYLTRDGQIAVVTTAGALVASGTLAGQVEVWSVTTGAWSTRGEHRWDLVKQLEEKAA